MTTDDDAGMYEEAREWCREHGIDVGADGVPIRAPVVGPTRDCLRCGTPAECVGEAAVCVAGGEVKSGGFCDDCYRLQFADPRAFWDGFSKEVPRDD